MSDLRARLAEVLALYESGELEYVEALLNGMSFLRSDELDRALEDAERMPVVMMELRHQRTVNDRLVRILAAIHMRCAPPDTKLEDGRVMRFVPPNPEIYWRELSKSVKAIEAEMKAIFDNEDQSAIDAARNRHEQAAT